MIPIKYLLTLMMVGPPSDWVKTPRLNAAKITIYTNNSYYLEIAANVSPLSSYKGIKFKFKVICATTKCVDSVEMRWFTFLSKNQTSALGNARISSRDFFTD